MSVKIDNSLELIMHLDFEHEPPCESNGGCEHAAVWKLVPDCCPKSKLFCDSHAEAIIDYIATRKHGAVHKICDGITTKFVIKERIKNT